MTLVEMEDRVCGVCGIPWSAPKSFMDECRKEGAAKTFYCPNGHGRVFRESEADKLRNERDRLQQKLAERDDEVSRQINLRKQAEGKLSQAKGQVTKLKTRASAGICPCCHRTVRQMAAHMKSKHPEFRAEAVS